MKRPDLFVDFSSAVIAFTGGTITSREELKAEAEALGARVTGTVSKATTLVVAGSYDTPRAEKAKQLGITICDFETWQEIVAYEQAQRVPPPHRAIAKDFADVEASAEAESLKVVTSITVSDDVNVEALAKSIGSSVAAILPAPTEMRFEDAYPDRFTNYYLKQIDWSLNTFGPAPRTKGILDHIRKELGEIESAPYDLMEWIDLITLALDGFHRHGGNPRMVLDLLERKQGKNFARKWPDWRTRSEDQAIEHDRSGE